MKKRTVLILITIIILLSLLFVASKNIIGSITTAQVSSSSINSYIKDSGDIKIYFCPQDNCENVTLSFLDEAEKEVHCAFYELSLESIQNKLIELNDINDGNKGKDNIEVQLVIDNSYTHKFNQSFVKFDSYGYMHNKFCIIDGEKILTGSMNPTNNGVNKNNNNILIIESKVLANNYESEFQELWNQTFKKGQPVLNKKIMLDTETFGSVFITNLFCPEDNCISEIDEVLNKAKKSINFLTFSFTHDDITNTMLVKKSENVEIKGVIEKRMATKYSPYQVFNYQNISMLRDNNSNTMHHKYFVVDSEVVVTGSLNPSVNGDENNDENVLILKNEKIAELYNEEFLKIYDNSVE